MEAIARFCLPLLRGSKWPKVDITGPARFFGKTVDLYRKAVSMAYVTAFVVSFDERNECLPDDDLEGRDPRW